MDLPPDQLAALRNLALKKSGQEVDWINISAARALTELGLAERDPAGWGITAAGQSWLNTLAAEPAAEAPSGDDAKIATIGPR